jgi:protein-disulfide isomerase
MHDRASGVAGRRQRRLQLLGVTIGAAAALVAIAIAVSSGKSGSSHRLQAGKPPPGAAQVTSRFGGIPQQGIALGNPKAPVTFLEFADLKCPVCREYTLSAFPTLVDRYVRTGKVRMVMELQHFVGDQDGDSERAARMALAAAGQNRLWQFADLFYVNQRDESTTYVTDPFLRAIAAGVPGLDVQQALAARDSPAITQQLRQSSAEFNSAGFTGTPSFAVGRTGGTLRPIDYNSFSVSQVAGPIDKLLGR